MPHFTVMVIGNNPKKQLAPFDENMEMPRYVKATKEQLIEQGKKEIEEYKNGTYAEFLADPEKYKANCTNDKHIAYLETEFPKKLLWTDEEIYKDAIKHYEPDELTPEGGVYSTYNPNSKWDWYSLGGRWTGLLKLKPQKTGKQGTPGLMTLPAENGYCDQAFKKDIDFEAMKTEAFEKYSKIYDEFLEKWNSPEEKKNLHPYFEYGIKNIANKGEEFIPETRENYIKRHTVFSTFAVIKDGEWYEKGEMGWWGMVSNKKEEDKWDEEFQNLIDSIPDDTLISIYDCHI